MKSLLVLTFLVFASNALASEGISQQLQSEFTRLERSFSSCESELTVGGVFHTKAFGDHEVLWSFDRVNGGSDVIRIYRGKKDEDAFVVAYFRSPWIIAGRTVIRRFVGPSITGWRNDTIDANTGEYLGMQGMADPELDSRDKEILKQWGIEFF